MKNSLSQLETLMCLFVQVASLGVHTAVEAERQRERGTDVWMSDPIRSEWVLTGLILGHGRRSPILRNKISS